MSARSAMIFVIDGLGAAHLGPYGNSWVGTPGFDAWAAESLVVEHAISDCPNLQACYRSYWQGRHAMCAERDQPPLAALCGSNNVSAQLITDAPDIANHHLGADFASEVVPINLQAELAATPERTHSARFAGAIITALERLEPPFCLWVHAMGLSGPWDCPYDMRMNFVDESDPEPNHDGVPPQFHDATADPDTNWGIQVAHAAQVSLIDASLALLCEAVDEFQFGGELLTLLTSPRGYPLGERGYVGYAPSLLHAEQLQVPLLVRGAPQHDPPLRTQMIAQPPDVFGTLVDWLSLDADRRATGAYSLLEAKDDDPHWQSAAVVSDGNRGLRTGGWYLEAGADNASESSSRLFVKPDDRLEVNEVAQRLPERVTQMCAALDAFQTAAESERLDQLEPLDAALREAWV